MSLAALLPFFLNLYNTLQYFLKDAFNSIRSFFSALLDTIKNTYDSAIVFITNVFKSLYYALVDLPLWIFKKLLQVILWLFQWASDSCAYCMGAAQGSGQLAQAFQEAWDTIGSYVPEVIYCLNRSGVVEAMQVLTCGLIIWSAFKVISFIKAIL